MSIYLGGKEIKDLYVGDKKVIGAYVNKDKVRPTDSPGIYYNSNLGIISISSDGKTWLSIADKNLGASSVNGYGTIYQRGNNYAFPYSGSVSTSSNSVNTNSYGPNNNYSSSIYITGSKDWSSPSNTNLWGDSTNTNEARRGPCAVGYHVPSIAEMNSVNTIRTDFNLTTAEFYYNYLKLPYNGLRDERAGVQFLGAWGFYRTSSSSTSDSGKGLFLQFSSSAIESSGFSTGIFKCYGFAIRPFLNIPITPDSSWTTVYKP